MSQNGLRMVVLLNFDITHLSPPSSKDDLLLKKHKYFQSTEVNLRLDEPVGLPDNILVVSVVEEVATPNRPGVLVQRVGLMHPGQ